MPVAEVDINSESNWRLSLCREARTKIQKRIMGTLQKQMCRGAPMKAECEAELEKISRRFEEKIFYSAAGQGDYVHTIAAKILALEGRAQSAQ